MGQEKIGEGRGAEAIVHLGSNPSGGGEGGQRGVGDRQKGSLSVLKEALRNPGVYLLEALKDWFVAKPILPDLVHDCTSGKGRYHSLGSLKKSLAGCFHS
jgi:hypothetical protein